MKDKEFNKQVAFRVRQLMQDKKLSQKDVADIIGRSQTSVCRMMRGEGVWRTEYLNSLAKFCDITPDYFTTHEANSDTILWGAPPREDNSEETDLRYENLKAQFDSLTEANDHLVEYTNDLLAELNEAKEEIERLKAARVSTGNDFSEQCRKQLLASVSLMQSVLAVMEVGG